MPICKKCIALLGSIILVVFLHGCASAPENTRVTVSEEVRNSIGNVGIVSVGPEPEPEALGTIDPEGATIIGAGAGLVVGGVVGVAGGVLAASLLCGPFAFACAGTALIVGATVGIVGGTASGVLIASESTLPQETVMELESALANALVDRDLRTEYKDHILAIPIADTGPNIIDLGVADERSSGNGIDYQSFTAAEVNTALEIGISQVALFQSEDEETEFALLINTYAQLTNVANNESLWRNEQIVYLSEPAELDQWTASGASHLRMEIRVGLEALARELSTQVLGTSE